MLTELRIPESEQQELATRHGIIDYETLKVKQYQLDRKQLSGVSQAAQCIIAAAIVYLDSLHCRDPLPRFTKNGWADFASRSATKFRR